MATLVFTALGTALGGPLGGAFGSLIGNQIDRGIAGAPSRQGPRLKELSVTTSSYGTPLPRQYGTMRTAGTIIWATDLVETNEKSGGGKGRPSMTTYSYSVSFAVALSSRPIKRVGRIWADGNLLRGAQGDLKVGGELRIYTGHGDQPADPIIAAERGAGCPAFRDLAYCVFENLQLAEFGNRIPALTFEVIADEGEVSLADLVEPLEETIETNRLLKGLVGYSNEGGALAQTLATVDQVYPLAIDGSGKYLSISSADDLPMAPTFLPEPAVDPDEENFNGATGSARRRQPDPTQIPEGLRYYDVSRDYQPGLQRSQKRVRPGRQRIIEFPGALDAITARKLASGAAERADWARESLVWRIAELDPALTPGTVVRVPGHAGHWRIETWEWRDRGVEMELLRLPKGGARRIIADPGEALKPLDQIATPTQIVVMELPWDGIGSSDSRQVFVAASSISSGWKGAALYLEDANNLIPLGSTGSRRSIIGILETRISASSSLVLDRSASFIVQLVSDDFLLVGASPEELAAGANRALIGGEIVQFAQAEDLGDGRWRIAGLLRGRGGTEPLALDGHNIGAPFVLLNDVPVLLDPAELRRGGSLTIAAIGLADPEPVLAELLNPGMSLRPFTPVHAHAEPTPEHGLTLRWTRRARGAWMWEDGLGTPLVEPAETYIVGVGNPDQPTLNWEVHEPYLELSPDLLTSLKTDHLGEPLWVRQVGAHGLSEPLLLTTLI